MSDVTSGPAAVYVSWTTFKNALEGLAQGVPNRIDRSAFPGQSGGVQAQLLAGLKFLNLIDDEGVPLPDLEGLVAPEEAARKQALAAILKDRYKGIFALGIEKMTPAQLNGAMSDSYGVNGDTREKAVRFFLSAAQYAEIPVSRFLQPKGNGNGGGGTRKRRMTNRPRAASEVEAPEGQDPGAQEPGSGRSRTVKLKSGGTLTLLASIDFFALSKEDRDFVFGLIDQLSKYSSERNESAE